MQSISMRDSFFNELYNIAKKDRNVVLISADCGAPSLDKYRTDLNSQFVNVGIAETNMVALSSGLALSGKKVYIYAIMPFVTLRCYEILKVTLSLMNLPVTVIGIGAGFSYPDSGPTHHSTEDMAIMRVLPNMTVLNSTDSIMAKTFANLTYGIQSPSYVRLDREILPSIYHADEKLDDGLKMIKKGRDGIIISTGNMVHTSIEVSMDLEKKGTNLGIIDVYRIKPLNRSLLINEIKDAKRLITIEEHMLMGGLGSVISELLTDEGLSIPLRRFGINDRYYYAYGGREALQELCGLNTGGLIAGIMNFIGYDRKC